MKKIKNGFWDYTERWERISPRDKAVNWEKTWLENSWCADCRYCCGPQDSSYPFPMALLKQQTGPDTPEHFHMLDCHTAFLAEKGCKSDSAQGCRLCTSKKPLACGLFPIVLVNGRLYLYQNCPAVVFSPLMRFLKIAEQAANMLMSYTLEDLRHISIWLCQDKLARAYIDLHIEIFNAHGKDLVFD